MEVYNIYLVFLGVIRIYKVYKPSSIETQTHGWSHQHHVRMYWLIDDSTITKNMNINERNKEIKQYTRKYVHHEMLYIILLFVLDLKFEK